MKARTCSLGSNVEIHQCVVYVYKIIRKTANLVTKNRLLQLGLKGEDRIGSVGVGSWLTGRR
jgi:hypothetical protein